MSIPIVTLKICKTLSFKNTPFFHPPFFHQLKLGKHNIEVIINGKLSYNPKLTPEKKVLGTTIQIKIVEKSSEKSLTPLLENNESASLFWNPITNYLASTRG